MVCNLNLKLNFQGRNGNGAIYMWAAGNGGSEDNCNCDGFVGSIYTIAITSISMDLEEPWYAERCTSIMAGTYGGDEPNPAVVSLFCGYIFVLEFLVR